MCVRAARFWACDCTFAHFWNKIARKYYSRTSYPVLEHLFLFQNVLSCFITSFSCYRTSFSYLGTSFSCFLCSFGKVILSQDKGTTVCPVSVCPRTFRGNASLNQIWLKLTYGQFGGRATSTVHSILAPDQPAKEQLRASLYCREHPNYFTPAQKVNPKVFLINSNYILVSIIWQLQRSKVFENALPNCNCWLIKLVKLPRNKNQL